MKKKISSRQVKFHFNESFDGSQEADDTVINIGIEKVSGSNIEDLENKIRNSINKALINFNIN